MKKKFMTFGPELKMEESESNDLGELKKKWIHLGLPPFLTRETTFVTSCLLSCVPLPI